MEKALKRKLKEYVYDDDIIVEVLMMIWKVIASQKQWKYETTRSIVHSLYSIMMIWLKCIHGIQQKVGLLYKFSIAVVINVISFFPPSFHTMPHHKILSWSFPLLSR